MTYGADPRHRWQVIKYCWTDFSGVSTPQFSILFLGRLFTIYMKCKCVYIYTDVHVCVSRCVYDIDVSVCARQVSICVCVA